MNPRSCSTARLPVSEEMTEMKNVRRSEFFRFRQADSNPPSEKRVASSALANLNAYLEDNSFILKLFE